MRKYDNLSVTNGKEALEKIKYLTLNEPSGYGLYSTQLKDTIHYFIIKKELDELAKYKRVFEILKEVGNIKLQTRECKEDKWYEVGFIHNGVGHYKEIEQEEYELLEELLNG